MDADENNLTELLGDFVDEAVGALQELPALLSSHRQQPDDSGPINAVFRSIHSLKGNASFFGLLEIKTFAHSLENTLDDIRKQRLSLTDELEREIVASFDHLDDLINAALAGRAANEQSPRSIELLANISQLTGASAAAPAKPISYLKLLKALEAIEVPGTATPSDWLQLVADEHLAELAAKMADEEAAERLDDSCAGTVVSEIPTPVVFLEKLGANPNADLVDRISAVCDLFVAFEQQTDDSQLGEAFVTAAHQVATWARETNRFSLADALALAAQNFRCLTDSPLAIDSYLLSIVWDKLWPELEKLVAPDRAEPAPDSLAKAPDESPESANRDAAKQNNDAGSKRLLRVKEERLDEFLTLVSRLFITGEMLKDLQSRMAETGQLRPLVDELRQIIRSFSEQTNSLQKGLFALRRVSILGLFSKFPRMVRSLAQDLGKQIDIDLQGGDTEFDKGLIEDLDAPLTHILRNAVDHGIDSPGDRVARGAPPSGRVTLTAELTRTHARIVVTDDGRGIDPARLKRKALEKNLMTQAQLDAMSDSQAIQLIFHPGFSTAEKLSDVSGRGVGLDVVRTSVRKHGGEVFVSSQLNTGTTFSLEVPLREVVIVIDGLMIRHGGQVFVIPFEHIREITQLDSRELRTCQGKRLATIRNVVYDARELHTVLDVPVGPITELVSPSAVLVGTPRGQICLLVDQVLGNRKVVVNGIEDILPGARNIAGVAQLGGGRLALVISVPEIVGSL